MSHTVKTGEFEGPLGVLLELIQGGKLEVSSVSVGAITSAYLEKVRGLKAASPEDLSEFLQLGARLLYIKSLALLPQANSEEQSRELEQLSLELTEYRRFQEAAKYLASRSSERTWQRPVAPKLERNELPLPNLALDQLAEAFTRALKFAPVATPAQVLKPHLSLETIIRQLQDRLASGFDLNAVVERCRDRLEIVVTFLALLELIKSGVARVTQAGQFDPIRVEAAHA